jgi:hypothetical protein
MTLIISLATADRVIQVSDRRATSVDGKVRDDSYNKAISVRCKDAVFAMSYTGTAAVGRLRTDFWIVQTLSEMNAGQMMLADLVEQLPTRLASAFPTFGDSRLSLVAGGYLGTTPFSLLISNFERINGRPQPRGLPAFIADAWIPRKGFKRRKLFCLMVNGAEQTVSERLEFRVKRFRKTELFRQATTDAIVAWMVSIVREAADNPGQGWAIGKDCMSIAMESDPAAEISCVYHPVGETTIGYAPHIIDPIGNVAGIEFESLPSTAKLVIFPTHNAEIASPNEASDS